MLIKKPIRKLLFSCRRIIFPTVLMFLVLPSAYSQRENIGFSHLSIEDGLSQNTVNCILKDSRGFMWFGTNDGLNKYDGYQFKIYRHSTQDSTSLSNNRVYSMIEDQKGNIWIATKSGLNRFIRETNSFKRYLSDPLNKQTLSHNFVRRVYEDSKGNIWIGTLGGGLNRYNPTDDNIERVKTNCASQPEIRRENDKVSSILEDSYGNLWIADHSRGIYLFSPTDNSLKYFPFSDKNDAPDNSGKTLFEDRQGNIWICTEGEGLYLLNRTTGKFQHYFYKPGGNSLSNNIVKDIFEDEKGQIWIATDGGGLDILDPETGKFSGYHYDISDPMSLSSNAIYCLYKDNHGILWIGTFNGGVNLFNSNKKAFNHFTQISNNKNSLSHKAVLAFCEDNQGNIWIGTDGGGVNLFNPLKESFKAYRHDPNNHKSLSSDVVTSILQDTKGRIWVGTYSGGLNLFNPSTETFTSYKHDPDNPNSLGINAVWTIYEDLANNLWIGTLGGLELFDPVKGVFTHYLTESQETKESVSPEKVTCILEDKKGNFWVGGSGLNRFDRITGRFFPIKDTKFMNYDIRHLQEDNNSILWIGLEGGGLMSFDPETNESKTFTSIDGLPNDAVHCIIEDYQENFWISTNKGISRFNRKTSSFRNYDINDGLQSNQLSYGAGLLASNGQIYFGGVNGFNYFYPDSIRDNPSIPNIEITELKIMNKPVEIGGENSPITKDISMTRSITLKHAQSVVTFEFTALNFTSPEKNEYRYKMEGFDDDWNDVGNKRTATYTNLNAGKYIFRVIGSNNDGKWNSEGASLEVVVLPPYWKTFWAFLVYALILFFMLYSYRNYSIKQQKLKNTIILKDIEKAKVEEVNQVKLRFFTNISHELRTPLTLILGPLERLLSTVKDPEVKNQLLTMRKSSGRLLNLVNELIDFRKMETGHMHLKVSRGDIIPFVSDIKSAFDELALRHKIQYTFKSNTSSFQAYFDLEKLDKIIYNLLSNAFKCTPDRGKIVVAIHITREGENNSPHSEEPDYSFGIPLKENFIEISVEDTGPGIASERIPHIFDRFYQVSGSEKTIRNIEKHGSGIGLDLTKDLVLMHHGEVSVISKPGKGSTFIIRLPQGREHFSGEEIKDFHYAAPEIQKYKKSDINMDLEELVLSEKPVRESSGKRARPTVLIVEDQSDLRSFIQDILTPDYEVFEAENGVQGCEIAYREIPDLIISDIMMPEMDGIQLCAELKNDESTNHIPIILLTAKSTVESKMEGFKTGADDYIPKPFSPDLLIVRLQNLISTRELLKEKFKRQFLLQPREVLIESADDKFLVKALKIVEDHISDPVFDVKQFVREIGMSRSVLYRKLEAVTGQSANEFLRNIRLKRAAQLLSQNKMTVSEVSYEVGFNDPQYFSKCFSKQFGKTPSDYAAGNSAKKR